MTVLGRYGASALKYWAPILQSAYKGLATADMWTAIRNTQAQYGLPTAQTQAPDVSVIRGYANRIVNGARAFAAASPSDTITSSMMATAPYTLQDAAGIAATPTYHVRYQVTVQDSEGNLTTAWQTSVFTATDFPSTVGGLIDAVNTNASELAATGGEASVGTPKGTLVSVANHEISVV